MNSVPQFMSKVECDFHNYITVSVGVPKSLLYKNAEESPVLGTLNKGPRLSV